jgi:3D (Asp-Asp-Asp) domain-containing protein
MTRKRKLILAGLVIALGVAVTTTHNSKQEEEIKILKEQVDNQREMLYNKNMELEDLNVKLKETSKVVNDLELAKKNLEEEIQKRETQQVSRGGGREIDVEVTYYTHTGNPTASGVMPQAEVTAACNFIPLGSHVVIDGHEYIIQDTGGALGNNVIDIFVDSEEEALSLGRQYTTARIL